MSSPQPEKRTIDISKLTFDRVKLEHLKLFPKMTGWLEPLLLAKLLLKVVVSDLFGHYADRRLIQASLDKDTPDESFKRTDVSSIVKHADESVWLDYVADLGDGFDATYAIAYLLAQPKLVIEGQDLPRAGALVFGGDEVYPTASRWNYSIGLRKPYEFAWPDTAKEPRPPLFALPGNHDW